MGEDIKREEILKVAKFLGMGYYRVKQSGEFVEADAIARELFGIPPDETDLSNYSLEKLYIFKGEKKVRIDKLNASYGKPTNRILSIRVNGETRLLSGHYWWDRTQVKEKLIAGLVAKIEDRVLFPGMFDEFPMGVYGLDDDLKVVYANKKTVEIFGYKNETDFLGNPAEDLYANRDDMRAFGEKVDENGFAWDILKYKNANERVIELECFTERIREFSRARWGMIHDVTRREQYYRGLDKMPTGYYYIEYDDYEKNKHHGHIVQCNDQFAKILGVENKHELVGQDVTTYYASKEEGETYFRHLEQSDQKGVPVLNYPFRLKRADNGEIVYISVDAHLVKENGKVIGREGTIRDLSEQRKIEEKAVQAEERFKRTTDDVNNLIHTFLHPVFKFYGHSELFHQVGNILYKSIRHQTPGESDWQKVRQQLEDQLKIIKENLESIMGESETAAVLTNKFKRIINVLDYNLDKAKDSKILLENVIRDTALWILEELGKIEFFNENKENVKKGRLFDIIPDNFINDLQNVLLDYLIRTASILKGETRVMRREVEALRGYIGLRKKRDYTFKRHNLGKILEENIEVFKPILAQKSIEIEYDYYGNLEIMISEPDIDRVVCNLLHNASKYSHPGPGRFVGIHAKELRPEDSVEFSITSYGIPIKKEEIDRGDIFKFGYRSELVYRTDRDGTGVGLADAKDVIEEHNGEITVKSVPPSSTKDPNGHPNYNIPHITTFTIKLPKIQKKGKETKRTKMEIDEIKMGKI